MPAVHVSRDKHIMTVAVEGVLSTEQVLEIIKEHYPSLGNRCILWDLTRADVGSLTKEGFVRIAAAARQFHPQSGAQKTAFAVADAASYVKICKYLNNATSARVAVEYNVFTGYPAAKQWLEKS